MNDMLVSVVIPVAAKVETLGRCVEAVARQTYARKETILVCDADACGSVDLPAGIEGLRVIREHRCGLARLIDIGMAAAKGHVKVLCMPHCIPISVEWIEKLVEPFKLDGASVGAVVSQCIPEDWRDAGLAARLLDAVEPTERRNAGSAPASQEFVSHLCDAYRASLLADIGSFRSEGLSTHAQAIAISIKVVDAGYSILLSNAAAVTYSVPRSSNRLAVAAEQALEFGRSDALLDRLYDLHWLNAGVLSAVLLSLLLLPVAAVSLPAGIILSAPILAWAAFLSLRLPLVGWECPLALFNFVAFAAVILFVRDDWRPELFGKHVHPAIIRQWCWLASITGSNLLIAVKASLVGAFRTLRHPRGALYAIPVFLLGLPWWLLTGVGYLHGLLLRPPRRR